MITRIHSASVYVEDQDASLDFYVNTLGFIKDIDNDMGGGMRFISVHPQGAATQLAISPAAWRPEGQPKGGNTGITFIADDINKTYDELVAKGVRFKEPVSMMPWGSPATWFYDLDGNEFFFTVDM